MDEDWLRPYMEEWLDYGLLTLRAKWTMDGASTLAEAAAMFRREADELERLAAAGFELDQPVADDYAIVIRPNQISPMRLVENEE